MEFNKELAWNIVLIVSVILIINGLQSAGDPDKKAAQAGQNTATLGAVGLAATGFQKAAPFLLGLGMWRIIVWPVAAVVTFFGSKLTGTIGDIINPSPAIPGWIWIGAFIILALLIMKGKDGRR